MQTLRALSILAMALAFVASNAASAAPAPKRLKFLPGRATPKAPPATNPVDRRAGFAPMPSAPAAIFSNLITTEAQYGKIASRGEGVVKSDVVKFLIDNRQAVPKIYFINGNYGAPNVPDSAKYHYYFGQAALKLTYDIETFNAMTYFTNDLSKKKFIAGTLQRYATTTDSFYGVQFYPQDMIAEASILLAVKTVRQAFSVPGATLKFVSYGLQQTVKTVANDLARLQVQTTSLDEIYKSIPYIAMNKGEAWGYLRTTAKDATPSDILLLNELPLDLSVVAGVITTVIQDSGSHVNLKSKERGTPDMVLRDPARVQALLRDFENRPIHLTVDGDDFKVVASSDDEVKAHAKKGSLKPWLNFSPSTDRTLRTYDEMAKVSMPVETIPLGLAYGGKASKLGFLAHVGVLGKGSAIQKELGYRLTPLGFGLPIAFYFDFVNANPALKAKIEALAKSEMSATPLAGPQKQAMIDDIQQTFYAAKVPPALVTAIGAKIEQFKADVKREYPRSELKKIKLRSSANSEDVEDFDGAGLHDSFSASLKTGLGDPSGTCRVVEENDGVATKSEMSPETVMCGLKGVYASLWNRRAVEERSYAHINHLTAGMAIAVNQTYGFREKSEGIVETANAVVITRVLAGSGIYGYQLSLNTAANLVTNPTPGTQSENVIATFLSATEKPSFTITQLAKPVANEPVRTESIVTPQVYARLVKLAQAVEIVYCKAVPGYYDGVCEDVIADPEKKKSLDMEFKIFSNGEVLVKQSREFSGR